MILEGEAGVRRPLASPDSRGGAFISAEGPSGGAFDLDKLKRMRDACDAMGMTIEGFRMDSGYIVMKPGPERDRKIDQILEISARRTWWEWAHQPALDDDPHPLQRKRTRQRRIDL